MEELFRKCIESECYSTGELTQCSYSPSNTVCAQKCLQFHCAFIRYEKGLSVEEIWAIRAEPADNKAAPESPSSQNIDETGSVELTFEPDDDEAEIESVLNEDDDDATGTGAGNPSTPKSAISEYEMVDAESDKMDDAELDELDAEIERELAEIEDI